MSLPLMPTTQALRGGSLQISRVNAIARPSASGTSDNYSNISIGAVAPAGLKRHILFVHGYIGQFTGSDRGTNTPTIGGSPITNLYLAESAFSYHFAVQFDIHQIDSGTTASINYTFDSSTAGTGLHVYRILSAGPVELVDSDSDDGGSPLSVSVVARRPGVIVCGSIPEDDSGQTMAFSGTAGIDTVEAKADINSNEYWGTGFKVNPAAGGITSSFTGASGSILGAVSLRPG